MESDAVRVSELSSELSLASDVRSALALAERSLEEAQTELAAQEEGHAHAASQRQARSESATQDAADRAKELRMASQCDADARDAMRIAALAAQGAASFANSATLLVCASSERAELEASAVRSEELAAAVVAAAATERNEDLAKAHSAGDAAMHVVQSELGASQGRCIDAVRRLGAAEGDLKRAQEEVTKSSENAATMSLSIKSLEDTAQRESAAWEVQRSALQVQLEERAAAAAAAESARVADIAAARSAEASAVGVLQSELLVSQSHVVNVQQQLDSAAAFLAASRAAEAERGAEEQTLAASIEALKATVQRQGATLTAAGDLALREACKTFATRLVVSNFSAAEQGRSEGRAAAAESRVAALRAELVESQNRFADAVQQLRVTSGALDEARLDRSESNFANSVEMQRLEGVLAQHRGAWKAERSVLQTERAARVAAALAARGAAEGLARMHAAADS
jgi:hypothetical protein